MATMKKRGRDLGKLIRKATGLKLPDAMRCGKLIVRGRQWDIPDSLCRTVPFSCGFECCGASHRVIAGPRGEFGL